MRTLLLDEVRSDLSIKPDFKITDDDLEDLINNIFS